MSPKGEKHACQAAPLDILSSLPENIIDDILLCLRLRDAVRTSILSKKWRYKWCRLPELTVDVKNLRSTVDNPELDYTSLAAFWQAREDEISSFSLALTNVICHIMTFHPGPITKFTLVDITLIEESTHHIDNLIHFLSKNGIQQLALRFRPRIPSTLPPSSEIQYSLPLCFSKCFQLRGLALENCSLQLLPPAFKGFDRLVILKLWGVTISSKLLQSLISHSPFLEQLLLHNILMDEHVIEINAPMLRSFDFRGNLRSICLKNVPLLAKLSLWIANFVESSSALEQHLYLNDMFSSPGVGAGEVPTRLPFVLHSVKHLGLLGCSFLRIFDVIVYALRLMRSFPNLQFFEIQTVTYFDDDKLLDLGRYSDITFNHLREVKYDYFRGTMCETEFINFLLANSPVLTRMVIRLFTPVELEESARVEILARLSKCKPASAKAEVDIILNRHESCRVSFVLNVLEAK